MVAHLYVHSVVGELVEKYSFLRIFLINDFKYSRMDQVKFVEDSF